MNRTLTLTSIVCLVLCMGPSCKRTDTYPLQFKYAPGMTFTYEQVSQGTVIAKEKDSVFNSRYNKIISKIEFAVRRVVDDTTWEIAQKMSSHFRTENKLDSSATDTTTSSPEMTMYVAPSGRIVDFEYGTTGSNAMDNMAYMKEYFRQGTPVFPSVPVPIGYSWTQSYTVTVSNTPTQVSTTYTVKGVEKRLSYDCVLVGYKGEMVIPFEADSADSLKRHGVDHIMNDGVMYQAYKEGLTVSQVETWTMNGDRLKTRKDEEVPYTVRVDYQVDYELKEFKKP